MNTREFNFLLNVGITTISINIISFEWALHTYMCIHEISYNVYRHDNKCMKRQTGPNQKCIKQYESAHVPHPNKNAKLYWQKYRKLNQYMYTSHLES